jgi:hypothetical protein
MKYNNNIITTKTKKKTKKNEKQKREESSRSLHVDFKGTGTGAFVFNASIHTIHFTDQVW